MAGGVEGGLEKAGGSPRTLVGSFLIVETPSRPCGSSEPEPWGGGRGHEGGLGVVVSGGQGWLWPQLQVRCAVRRGWRRREKQSRRRLELVARNGIPGLGSQACASSCTARAGIAGSGALWGKRLQDAGKAMGKECRCAGARGGWRVREACGAEINRRAPPTPTSRSLTGHWPLRLAREGGRVSGKAGKPGQLFRGKRSPPPPPRRRPRERTKSVA